MRKILATALVLGFVATGGANAAIGQLEIGKTLDAPQIKTEGSFQTALKQGGMMKKNKAIDCVKYPGAMGCKKSY